MGADGGFGTIQVRNLEQAAWLLAPWWYRICDLDRAHDSVWDHSLYAWFNVNKAPKGNYLVSAYGTDISEPSIDGLQDFHEQLRSKITYETQYGLHVDSTFADVLLEWRTRPETAEWVSNNPFAEERYNDWMDYLADWKHEDKEKFLGQIVGVWLVELEKCCLGNLRADCYETWT